MMDEKKIEEAANNYLLGKFEENVIGYSDFKDVPKAFKAGINWFLDNLWHDVKEEPKTFKRLIAECRLDKKEYKSLIFLGTISWEGRVESNGITRWFYIDDLLKGGE